MKKSRTKKSRRPRSKVRSKVRYHILISIVAATAILVALLYLGNIINIDVDTQKSTEIKTANTISTNDASIPYEGFMAPEFTVSTIDGDQVSLKDFRGKTVVIWFMAAWCPSCTFMGFNIERLYNEYRDRNIEIIVIDMWSETLLKKWGILGKAPPPESPEILREFIVQYSNSLSWRLIFDSDAYLTELYEIKAVDSIFIVDPSGKIAFRSDGPTSYDILSRVMSEIYGQSNPT